MNSFVDQLNKYGFTKVTWLTVPPRVLAEEEVTAACRKASASIGSHTNRLSHNSPGRDGGSIKRSHGSKQDGNGNKCSDFIFLLCTFPATSELPLLSKRARETASAADLEELVGSSGSASTKHAGWDQAPDGPAAGTAIAQEHDSPTFTEEEETKSSSLSSSEECDEQASDFSSLNIPQELCLLHRSDRVKSIWWALVGNCIVIKEELFTIQILAKEAPVRAFGHTSMNSFVGQLNKYGFAKVTWLTVPPRVSG
ncbi:hypothetical protein ASZ78_002545 [Callipepla squamata]|uniref:HSF-type DNA-binding domain-containing protein n=1 Tax=Callipepla squamata TaxID=9009 RepID=A0A226N1G8_CALSU|nr:hypothetical protein ASZ78_002545 [Callipepla squamata]